MEPNNLRFGGGVGQSMVHPIILVAVLIAAWFLLFSSRRNALNAFLSAALLIPMDQVILIGPLHFPMLRLLIIVGAIRMIRAKFANQGVLAEGWNRIDYAMVVLTLFIAINGVLLYPQAAAVIYQLGNLYTAFGAYFLLRYLIRDENDLLAGLRTLAYIAIIVAVIMSYEQATGKNPYYAYLGGANAHLYGASLERDNKFRATGCFGHPILAGTFGAICLPLFAGLWGSVKSKRWLPLMGIGAATIIPIAANSSTSLLGFGGGILALCLWRCREWTRQLRWALALVIIGLHMVMKAPVWHLISRIDLTGGSSGYHRYQLINQCILHFKDWWLIGTKSYADWGWDMWDLSDQYVGTADTSGLLPLIAFVAIIVFGFSYLGRARKLVRHDRKTQWLIWALGSSLFANVVAFFGIGYFDQTIVAWYCLLAMIPVAVQMARQSALDRSERKSKKEHRGELTREGEEVTLAATTLPASAF